MSAAAGDLRHVRTERLRLDAVEQSDLEPMYLLYSDPEVWRHLPGARHPDRERTERFIATMHRSWDEAGLGHWAARVRSDLPAPDGPGPGAFVGVGGCARRLGVVWNVYYRLSPAAWRRGFASEIVAAGIGAAGRVDPDLPVVAYLVEHNVASRRTAEHAGLTLAWRGPDHGNPDPAAVRLVYSDRPLPPRTVETLVSQP